MQDIRDCVVLDWDSIHLISAVLLMDYIGIFFLSSRLYGAR